CIPVRTSTSTAPEGRSADSSNDRAANMAVCCARRAIELTKPRRLPCWPLAAPVKSASSRPTSTACSRPRSVSSAPGGRVSKKPSTLEKVWPWRNKIIRPVIASNLATLTHPRYPGGGVIKFGGIKLRTSLARRRPGTNKTQVISAQPQRAQRFGHRVIFNMASQVHEETIGSKFLTRRPGFNTQHIQIAIGEFLQDARQRARFMRHSKDHRRA